MEHMDWLFLYGQASVFIYVFMEIVATTKPFKHVIHKQVAWPDKFILVVLFGGFSIFGTYIGIPLPSGAIMSIRDLGPMIAGIVAGPVVGLGAGLIGGIHRLYLGGLTAAPCGLGTIFAGIFCGAIHRFKGGRIVGLFQGVIIAAIVECVHMGFVLLMIQPLDEAIVIVRAVILPMIVANSLGMFFVSRIISRELDTTLAT